MKCPECQSDLPDDSNFCLKCGQKLNLNEKPSCKPIPEAERKHVTVLFSDLSGYTTMSERLDPEKVKEITGRIFGEIAQIIAKYEGFIEKFIGDAVVAIFGIPQVHEDDPIRAIRAAQEIHALVETLSPKLEGKVGRPLNMHSGINTGLVVTGKVDLDKGTHGLAGDTINLAARLQGLARNGEILVGKDTYHLARRHFNFEPMAPAKVKGKAHPVRAFKVISTKPSDSRVSADRRVSSVMVGRNREMDRLEFQVHKAVNGQGSVVNVIGEAGIGKSRLITELKKREVMGRVTLLEGRSISIGKNLCFYPIIDLLKHWAGISENDIEALAFDKLEKAIRTIHPEEASEILPFVATLMGMKLMGKSAERVHGIEGEALENLILKNFRALMIKGSELRPMVIVIEDLHWVDNSSLGFLRSLYGLTEKHRILFINVLRPGYLEEDGAKAATGTHERIEIQPLGNLGSEALINNMLEIKGLPFSIKDQILVGAGGNPFFIEEVVRSLIDDGTVVKSAQGFEVTKNIDRVVIPPTINDVIMARIDRLEEQTRNLIKVASVIGRSFFDRILKEVATSIDSVDERISYLKDAQFIKDRLRMEELEYQFKHALAQEAVYESTLLEQRKALHLKVAQSIEKIFQERLHEFYGMLAFHYSKADDLEKAEEYMTKAGDEALRSTASSEALYYFKEALKLYLTKYDRNADPRKLANFEKNIGIALYNKGQWQEAIKYFDSVSERWGAPLPKRGRLGMLRLAWDLLVMIKVIYLKLPSSIKSPEDRDEKIRELYYRAATALAFYDHTRQLQVAMAIMRHLMKFDLSKIPRVSVYWAAIASVFSVGGLSFKLSNRLLEVSRQYRVGGDIGERMQCVCFDTMVHHCQGAWEKIEKLDEAQLNSSLKIGEISLSSLYLFFYGLVKAEQGEFAGLAKAIEKTHEIGEAFDYPMAIINSLGLKTVHFNVAQRTHEAISVADKGISYCRKEGPELQEFMFIGMRAGNQQLAGDQDGARDSIFVASKIYEKQSSTVWPFFMAPYLALCFFVDVDQLRQAIRSENSSDMVNLQKRAYESGKAAVRNSRKYAPHRTRIFRLMGLYYWLIGQQGKALKWWDKTIQEGERLGARPDLSRTYFEVGKRLLEPKSKYKELNGIAAKDYLEKARALFDEMGLERDLEELDKFASRN